MSRGATAALKAVPGVMLDPRGTFGCLKETPFVLVPLLTLALVNCVYAIVTLPKIRELAMHQIELAGDAVPAEQVEIALKAITWGAPAGAIFTAVAIPLAIALALLLIGQFVEGDAPFRGLVSLVAYAQMPSLLKGLAVTVIGLATPAQEMQNITTSLALILPREQAGSTLYRLLSFVDPFVWWGLYVMIVGYAAFNSFTMKKSAKVIIALYLVYAVISFLLMKRFVPTPGV
ncbi:MAG: YIP1 family protein [Bacillota bacterium]